MKQTDESKNSLKEIFFEKLKIISEKESKITKLGKKLLTFVSILNTLGTNFQHIEMIHCLDAAYSLSLLEISRRRKFHQMFIKEIKISNLNLKLLEEKEIETRKKFTRNVGKYLPNTLIPGFNDQIQKFEIEIFESNLPRIESSKKFLNLNQIEKLFKNSFEEEDLKIYDEIEEDENDHFKQFEEEEEEYVIDTIKHQNDSFNLNSSFIKKSKEKEKEKRKLKIEFENLKKENEKFKIEIKKEKEKKFEIEIEFENKKNLYKTTEIEIIDRNNEFGLFLKENKKLKEKIELLENGIFEKEIILNLKKEKNELEKSGKLKEKLRHETALNCAHAEKKLNTMTKNFEKSKIELNSFQEKFKKISKILNFDFDFKNSNELEKLIKIISEMVRKINK